MNSRYFTFTIGCIFVGLCVLAGVFIPLPSASLVHAQQPTGSVPTVTGTPSGPSARVDPSQTQVRVYAGPSSFDYPAIGIVVGGERVYLLGYAEGRRDWVQIVYAGVPGGAAWIFAPFLIEFRPGELPDLEIPFTPTPRSTPAIDPTLEAGFIGQQTPTRLPTFTPPPPLNLPSFSDADSAAQTRLPAGLLIFSLGLIGFFGALISYLRGR